MSMFTQFPPWGVKEFHPSGSAAWVMLHGLHLLGKGVLRAGPKPWDGVTISGGEPLAQAEACAELATRLNIARMHVVVYTGYAYDILVRLASAAIQQVLALADVLVDGPYVAALRDPRLAYRGSSNQTIIDLCATRRNDALTHLQDC